MHLWMDIVLLFEGIHMRDPARHYDSKTIDRAAAAGIDPGVESPGALKKASIGTYIPRGT